jgi:type IV secretory pathway protease TraF
MAAQVKYSVAGRSVCRVTSCTVCTVYMKTRITYFLVEPQNQSRWFVSGLASKPLGWFVIETVFSGLTSKSVASGFLVWVSKPAAAVW